MNTKQFRTTAKLAPFAVLFLLPLFSFGQRAPHPADNASAAIKPSFDALSLSPAGRSLAPSARSSARPGTEIQVEDRLGVPTFFWAAKQTGTQTAASTRGQSKEEAAARAHLERYAAVYRLDRDDLRSAVLKSVHNTGDGPVIVQLGAVLDGVEVFRERINISMDQQFNLVAISGYLIGLHSGVNVNRSFTLTPAQAIAASVNDLLDLKVSEAVFQRVGLTQGSYEQYGSVATPAAAGFRMDTAARVKRVFFRFPDRVEAAYYVEVTAARTGDADSHAYGYVISASSGQLLFRKNQTDNDQYSYRAWADTVLFKIPKIGPQGNLASPKVNPVPDGVKPPFIPASLVTLQNGPISTNDPWLAPAATMTIGNNVEAFADIASPDGYQAGSADTYGFTSSPGAFDHLYDLTQGPQANSEQIQGAITQLFYNVNFFHDWYYDSGFKEVDGNAQVSNYGRGGIEGDSIFAEAQDFAGRNNANMSTPADGGRPRMRMYIFDGPGSNSITATGAVTGTFTSGTASFGSNNFNVTGSVVRTIPSDSCTAVTNDLTGKIAFVDRGNCAFVDKARNAQLAGAAGVIIANVPSSSNPDIAPGMSGTDATVTVGTLSLNLADGDLFRAALDSSQAVSATLLRTTGADRDGSLDNQIVAHEWGHYISNRLIYDASGLNTNMAGGLGEGWADFHAMLISVKPSDTLLASNPTFNGSYALAGYATDDFYFGIRRVPYSTTFTLNPLTFRDIADGTPLPTIAPIAFGQDGSNNAEVHNTGEVWSTMLWECYAAMLRDTLGSTPRRTFIETRERMKRYIVAAYKMTPASPTLLEARDAVLAAAYATNQTDFTEFAKAFAKRGAGTGAVAPDRFSSTNTPGLVESFKLGGDVAITSISIDDSIASCDQDGALDQGETGRLTIAIKNTGVLTLSNTVATVSSTTAGVTFPSGNTVSFAASNPFDEISASIPVSLVGVNGLVELHFTVSVNDPKVITGMPAVESLTTYGNYNTAIGSSSDDVESPVTTWTTLVGSGAGSWSRSQATTSPLNYVWQGPDTGGGGERYLVSPDLLIGAEPFSFSFSHRYSFEADSAANYDGGVVELSTDGGTTWSDIGAGYNGVFSDCCGNPLAGRSGYVAASPGYPAFTAQAIELGTAYANQTVKIRFHIAEDAAGGGPGWEIDNLVFTGLTNAPFSYLTIDSGCPTVKIPATK